MDLRDEIAHVPDVRLGFVLVLRIDDISDLLTLGVHSLELIRRHFDPPPQTGNCLI